MALHIGNFFDKKIQKGISNNKVSISAPKNVWVSLDRYEKEFGKINTLSFSSGMEKYLEWFVNKYEE